MSVSSLFLVNVKLSNCASSSRSKAESGLSYTGVSSGASAKNSGSTFETSEAREMLGTKGGGISFMYSWSQSMLRKKG